MPKAFSKVRLLVACTLTMQALSSLSPAVAQEVGGTKFRGLGVNQSITDVDAIVSHPRMIDAKRDGDLAGIIHLHGHVDEDYSSADGDNFILSSAEFGRAYLSEGWATNFIRSVLEKYTVVFVG